MFHSFSTSTTEFTQSPTQTTGSEDPLSSRFGAQHRLPRGLREEAAGMDWKLFAATYAPLADIRFTNLKSEKLRAGMFHYRSTMLHTSKTTESRSELCEITSTGPAAACTSLLAGADRRVEILKFHQLEIFEATATFIHTTNDHRSAWAVGFGSTPETSVAAALSSAAQRLYG